MRRTLPAALLRPASAAACSGAASPPARCRARAAPPARRDSGRSPRRTSGPPPARCGSTRSRTGARCGRWTEREVEVGAIAVLVVTGTAARRATRPACSHAHQSLRMLLPSTWCADVAAPTGTRPGSWKLADSPGGAASRPPEARRIVPASHLAVPASLGPLTRLPGGEGMLASLGPLARTILRTRAVAPVRPDVPVHA